MDGGRLSSSRHMDGRDALITLTRLLYWPLYGALPKREKDEEGEAEPLEPTDELSGGSSSSEVRLLRGGREDRGGGVDGMDAVSGAWDDCGTEEADARDGRNKTAVPVETDHARSSRTDISSSTSSSGRMDEAGMVRRRWQAGSQSRMEPCRAGGPSSDWSDE